MSEMLDCVTTLATLYIDIFSLIVKICYSSVKHKFQEVTFRTYKDINVAQFRADILASPSLNEFPDSTDELV